MIFSRSVKFNELVGGVEKESLTDTSIGKPAKHILCYIAGTTNFGLLFARSGSADCTDFSEADWAGDIDDHKSMSGYIFKIGGGPVSWKNVKKVLCCPLNN